jgi:hypothetical protein
VSILIRGHNPKRRRIGEQLHKTAVQFRRQRICAPKNLLHTVPYGNVLILKKAKETIDPVSE